MSAICQPRLDSNNIKIGRFYIVTRIPRVHWGTRDTRGRIISDNFIFRCLASRFQFIRENKIDDYMCANRYYKLNVKVGNDRGRIWN